MRDPPPRGLARPRRSQGTARRRWLTLTALLAGCKDPGDLRLRQYQTVPAPVSQGVQLHLDDIERGRHAEIRVIAPDGHVLGVGDLEVGEALPFAYRGKAYLVRPTRYEDHTFHEDVAELRVEQRAFAAGGDTVAIAEGATGSMPGRPGEQITVEPIELDRLVSLEIKRGDEVRREAIAVGGQVELVSERAAYRLVLIAVAFGADGIDHAYLRLRPGRH